MVFNSIYLVISVENVSRTTQQETCDHLPSLPKGIVSFLLSSLCSRKRLLEIIETKEGHTKEYKRRA